MSTKRSASPVADAPVEPMEMSKNGHLKPSVVMNTWSVAAIAMRPCLISSSCQRRYLVSSGLYCGCGGAQGNGA